MTIKRDKDELIEKDDNSLEKIIEGFERKLLKCDTDGGLVHVDWDDDSPITPLGQFVFFAHFLKSCGLFQDWVDSCPDLNKGHVLSQLEKK